jgi:hypothetical protein
MIALYALAVFIPITAQILAQHAKQAVFWRFMAVLSVAYLFFGWNIGAHVSSKMPERAYGADWAFPLVLLFGVLWLLVLPFVQCRLTTGRWTSDYRALFSHAWNNKLMLAEAALFTGLFWFLLFLWQMLFHMLKIDFFQELFEEPIFVYPVTALTFGCAMHLTGSIAQLTSSVLEQVLNVLKWLATIAGFMLTLFTIALLFSVPNLMFTGQRAIGANWLLWLLAVMVLLLNAAYRDGSVLQPYPKRIAACLRAIVPMMVIVALTALYALIVRARYYGLTVERFWAFVVAGAGLLYSSGYSIAAFRKGAWLGLISRVNVIVAIALIAIISASLTPLLSPYRLAANSQFWLVQAGGLKAIEPDQGKRTNGLALQNSPLRYLRFDAGAYGRDKLKELADSYAGADAEAVRRSAGAMLRSTNRWEAMAPLEVPELVSQLRVYPAGRTLDQGLVDKLTADLSKTGSSLGLQYLSGQPTAGLFIDLNHDGVEEFVFLTAWSGRAYENRQGSWVFLAEVSRQPLVFPQTASRETLIDDLSNGKISTKPSNWDDLVVGTLRYRLRTPD